MEQKNTATSFKFSNVISGRFPGKADKGKNPLVVFKVVTGGEKNFNISYLLWKVQVLAN
ncbi:MAG: hypothetical protein ACXWV1_12485 [Chitinophagaceae bacterium]